MSQHIRIKHVKKKIKKRSRLTLKQRVVKFKSHFIINHRFTKYARRLLFIKFNKFRIPLKYELLNWHFRRGFKTRFVHPLILRGVGIKFTQKSKNWGPVRFVDGTTRNLFSLFASFFIKRGKNWRLYIDLVVWLGKLCKLTQLTRVGLLTYLFLRLNTKVEVRRLRIRRRTHFVPFFISVKRQLYLVLRWLNTAVKSESKILSTYMEKIFLEIRKVLFSKNSVATTLVLKNNLLAYKNRSSAHFRW